ncbi:MAG: HAMP domain-containing histidine kinase [Ferruginibacter sp.]|nr:HAMP domain-containing histidine kinase [Cytophagales bacterium]
MKSITDEELVAAIEQRLKDKQQALGESEDLLRQLKRANQQLEAAEKLKTRFLSNIRNQINDPFGAILCLSENMMQLDSSQFDHVLAIASLIHREAFKLHFQLQNIFTAADLEAGEVTLAPTQIDVASLIQHVLATFRPAILEKSLRVKAHGEPTSGPVTENQPLFRTDAGKLKLILSNLLANAIGFSEPGETLEIAWSLREALLQIRVSDHGSGIEEKHLEDIFNRFTQLNATPTRLHGGHGLGLSVVQALLETMGGGIVVQSVPRQGSVFVVNIPELAPLDGEENFSDGSTLFFDVTDRPYDQR